MPWIGIAIYFFGSASNGEIPTFVYFIFGSLFVLFFTFAVNMVLQYKKVGRWKDYAFRGSRVYIAESDGQICPGVAGLWGYPRQVKLGADVSDMLSSEEEMVRAWNA